METYRQCKVFTRKKLYCILWLTKPPTYPQAPLGNCCTQMQAQIWPTHIHRRAKTAKKSLWLLPSNHWQNMEKFGTMWKDTPSCSLHLVDQGCRIQPCLVLLGSQQQGKPGIFWFSTPTHLLVSLLLWGEGATQTHTSLAWNAWVESQA